MDPSMYIVCQSSPPVFILPPISQNQSIDGTDLMQRQTQITNSIFQKASRQSKVQSSSVRRSVAQNYNKSVRIVFEISDGFALNEEILISKAMGIIANRLFKPGILQNMYHYCGTKGVYLVGDVWQHSNLSKHSINHGKHFLLEYQLMCLKAKIQNDEFPIVKIYPMYEENYVAGRGSLTCVSCISNGSHLSITGQFEIYLNRYHLHASAEDGSDLVQWAGVIVHEMLHNLGHNHDENDYSNRWQINVFTKCFEHDGNYYS